MRIAIKFPDGSIAAWKHGRIVEGEHNVDPITDDIIPLEKYIALRMEQARKDPHVVQAGGVPVLQRMVMDDHDADTSKWIDDEEFDPEVHVPTRPGGQLVPIELHAQTKIEPKLVTTGREEE